VTTTTTPDPYPHYYRLRDGSIVTRGLVDELGLAARRAFVNPGEERGRRVRVVSLDAEVITADRLPKVEWNGKRWVTVPDDQHEEQLVKGDNEGPEWFQARAEEYLAMARHLRSDPTPPDDVDEEQVEALARILAKRSAEQRGEIGPGWRSFADEARHLVQQGVRAGGDPS